MSVGFKKVINTRNVPIDLLNPSVKRTGGQKQNPQSKMKFSLKLGVYLWIGFGFFCTVSSSFRTRFNYFDDYLSSLNEEQQARITGEDQFQFEGSGQLSETQERRSKSFDLPLRTGLTKSRDVTCCSLGQMAGDKGYHCIGMFYAARILLRNQNRAHNKKLGFYGHDSVPHYGSKLMRTFEQCVANKSTQVFYKCCNVAAVERKVEPHFDNLQRRRYEMKMRRIRIPKRMQVDDNLIGV